MELTAGPLTLLTNLRHVGNEFIDVEEHRAEGDQEIFQNKDNGKVIKAKMKRNKIIWKILSMVTLSGTDMSAFSHIISLLSRCLILKLKR